MSLRSATAAARRTSLEDVVDGKAWVAFAYDGEPLDPEHGACAAARHLTCTSGRAPSGCADSSSRRQTSRVLGAERLPLYGDTRREQRYWGDCGWSKRRGRSRDAAGQNASPDVLLARPSAGQHVDPPADEDGYQAQRSYSIASRRPPRLRADGRTDRGRRGIAVPLRRAAARRPLRAPGPVGGYFVWEPSAAGRCCSSRRVRCRAVQGDAAPPRGRGRQCRRRCSPPPGAGTT